MKPSHLVIKVLLHKLIAAVCSSHHGPLGVSFLWGVLFLVASPYFVSHNRPSTVLDLLTLSKIDSCCKLHLRQRSGTAADSYFERLVRNYGAQEPDCQGLQRTPQEWAPSS